MPNAVLQQARDLLLEMKSQAEDGTMIPFRIPGQLDAILALVDEATSAESEAVVPQAVDASPGEDAELSGDAEDILEETSRYISIAVHEMRIPLTSIRGYSDMLAKKFLGPLNDQQEQFVETIQSNSMRMVRLIADVNDVAKIRANRLHLDAKMDMAKNIIMGVEKDTADLAVEKNISLTFEVPDGLPMLNVDGARVTQALRYMVENAIMYSPEGSVVTVTASGKDNTLKIVVVDEGVGMTEEELPHFGEPFWRSEHEVVRSVKGHGLGIAVAKGIIKLLGGQFIVETEPEKGSTIGFTLPGMA